MSSKNSWNDNPVYVFFSLYFLFFFFSLPALWRNARFSTLEKIIMTSVSLLENYWIFNKMSYYLLLYFQRIAYIDGIIDQLHK